jgi:transposase
MLKNTMYKKIKQLQKSGKSIMQIVGETSCDYKTVKKYTQMKEDEFRSYRQEHLFRPKKFDELEDDILSVYEANDNERLVMSSVYDYLEERFETLPGNEGSLRNYIHYLQKSKKLVLNKKTRLYTKVPELPYGQQMQLDFGEYKVKSGLKLYIFATLLSGSRYKYAAFQKRPFTAVDVIQHLLDSFAYFGGIPKELVIDQDKTMVVSEKKDFSVFIAEMELDMYVCKKADPESKGKIENMVKFIKQNLLNCRDFSSVNAANESLQKWLIRRANGKISQATMKIPSREIEKERLKLRPLRNSIYQIDQQSCREERVASDKARISVKGSQYQLPFTYKNRAVQTFIAGTDLYVFDYYTGEKVTKHRLSQTPGALVVGNRELRDRSESIRQLKEKVMALYSGQDWVLFNEALFKRKKREIRDQCCGAIKYFSNISNPAAFSSALRFCIENNTHSVSDLNDTYKHFLQCKEELPIPKLLNTHCPSKKIPAIKVDERELNVYSVLMEEMAS